MVRETVRRRGKVIIPSFAVGRTQELVYTLNQLRRTATFPRCRSTWTAPGGQATEVFRLHPEEWDEEVATFLKEEGRRNPFDATHVEYVRDVVRSKKLNYLKESAIIISANGMAENGRILHHLKNNIEEPENTILIVSFQAEHTLGRKLASGAPSREDLRRGIRCAGQGSEHRGYSAHADQAELLA